MGMVINKVHISVIGRANVGKSRLIDCIFDQRQSASKEISGKEFSDQTDSERILPNGAIANIAIIIIDDNTDFDSIPKEILKEDFLILVLDAREELYKSETELIAHFQNNHIPFLVAVNKIEFGTNPYLLSELEALEVAYFELSCKENAGIESFRNKLIHMLPDK